MLWVRAVAVALAVGCWAVGVQAAQYAEVWNPPEARHAPKKEKVHAPAGKKVAGKGVAVKGKNKPHKPAPKKAVPHAGHKAAPHVERKTATHAGHVEKAHSKVAAKGEPKKSLKAAQSQSSHVHATVHPKEQKVAGRSTVAHTGSSVTSAVAKPAVKPVATRDATQAATSAPAQSAPAMGSMAAKPAASGGNLPPILH